MPPGPGPRVCRREGRHGCHRRSGSCRLEGRHRCHRPSRGCRREGRHGCHRRRVVARRRRVPPPARRATRVPPARGVGAAPGPGRPPGPCRHRRVERLDHHHGRRRHESGDKQFTVSCPAGDFALSGGFDIQGSVTAAYRSSSTGDPTGTTRGRFANLRERGTLGHGVALRRIVVSREHCSNSAAAHGAAARFEQCYVVTTVDAVDVHRARERRSRGLADRPRRGSGRVARRRRPVRRRDRTLDVEAAAESEVASRTAHGELLVAGVRAAGDRDDGRAVQPGCAGRTLGAGRALRAGSTSRAGITLVALRAGSTRGTGVALRSGKTLGASGTRVALRAGKALGPGRTCVALRAGKALSAGGTGVALCAVSTRQALSAGGTGVALRTGVALLAGGPDLALWPLGTVGTRRTLSADRAGVTRGALRARLALRAGVTLCAGADQRLPAARSGRSRPSRRRRPPPGRRSDGSRSRCISG